METQNVNFKLETFEGPLDLLLHLISKNKVSICDIPIAKILDQYLEYIHTWQAMNFDFAGEFIVMASELMLIKSKMLLPKVEDDNVEDPREALAKALIEYKKAKECAQMLDDRFKTYHGRIIKEPEVIEADIDYSNQDIDMLYSAFKNVVRRVKLLDEEVKNEVPSSQLISNLLKTKHYSVYSKIIEVMRYLYVRDSVEMFELFQSSQNKSELVTVFVAILELLKSQRIFIDEKNSNSDFLYLYMDKETHFSSYTEEMANY